MHQRLYFFVFVLLQLNTIFCGYSNVTTVSPDLNTTVIPTTSTTNPGDPFLLNITLSNGTQSFSALFRLSIVINNQSIKVPASSAEKPRESTEFVNVTLDGNRYTVNLSWAHIGDFVSLDSVSYAAGKISLREDHVGKFKSSFGFGFRCNHPQFIVLSNGTTNVSLNFTDYDVRVFVGSSKKYVDCLADANGNPLVPIIVGSVLAGLIVVIIVAFFIGRKMRGYAGYEQL